MADKTSNHANKAGVDLVELYYTALQGSRHTISSYYVPKEELPDGKSVPVIAWNGHTFEDGKAFERMFMDDMPYTFYTAESIDCHSIDAELAIPASKLPIKDTSLNFCIAIHVSGTVRLDEAKSGPVRGYSETFVLVPNMDRIDRRGPMKNGKNWLIQNQIFRYVV